MKNIHVLPTDKPSRLYHWKGNDTYNSQFRLRPIAGFCDFNQNDAVNQNIYITSDEEIKVGDWYYLQAVSDIGSDSGAYRCEDKTTSKLNTLASNCKKIILTTDTDLIKDGVQAIDDEFLEWFVKNPSCEEVEVHSELNMNGANGLDRARFIYKIIIPKEESKQETLINDTDSHSWGFENFEVIKTEEDAKIFIEALEKITEPNEKLKKAFREYEKQETLEEAAERLYPNGCDGTDRSSEIYRRIFIEGAKWQQERMYSEEEVNLLSKMFKLYWYENNKEHEDNLQEWKLSEKLFEQFKKK